MDVVIKENMVMLGKIRGYPKWPCVILNERGFGLQEKPNETGDWYPVQFFNDGRFAWLKKSNLTQYQEKRVANLVKEFKNNKPLLGAVREADLALAIKSQNPHYYIKVRNDGFITEESFQRPEKRGIQELLKISIHNKKIKSEHPLHSFQAGPTTSSKENVSILKFECQGAFFNGAENITHAEFPVKTENLNKFSENKNTLGAATNTKELPKQKPSLGVMIGKEFMTLDIVKKLHSAGYALNMIDCAENKRNKLEKRFSSFGTIWKSPKSILLESNTLLLFMADGKQARETVANKFTKNLNNKCIINVTDMEPEASAELGKTVERFGGKYLELAIQGTRTEIVNGTVLVFAAGNKSVFEESLPIFKVFASSADFLGPAGYALKLNLTLQMMKSVILGTFGHSIALIESAKFPKDQFFEILKECGLTSQYLRTKLPFMQDKNFSDADERVEDLQQQLELFRKMADKLQREHHLGNAASEIFQEHSSYRGYDTSVVAVFK